MLLGHVKLVVETFNLKVQIVSDFSSPLLHFKTCSFLAEIISNFVSLSLKLHNRYCRSGSKISGQNTSLEVNLLE